MHLGKVFNSVVTTLSVALPQMQTNGASKWGTSEAPSFPKFLKSNPLPGGFPWGNCTASGTNQYKEVPYTGVTRYYDFTINRKQLAPDGVTRSVILVNGQFPGPAIEANWGDWIEVKVHNGLDYEGTAIHWHGLLQKETQWYDGVPSVTQCPVAPGATFTYRFRADLYGSSWWHAHYSGQYTGGVLGPMIIYGPNHVDYDTDLGPVFITDWYYRSYLDIIEDIMSTNSTKVLAAGVSNNNLINGRMSFDCTKTDRTCKKNAGVSKFVFQPGKKHRLRIINAGAEGLQHFSIDEHEMTVIALDFVPVEPYKTNVLKLGIAQRVDVIVKAKRNSTRKSFWMRSVIQTDCTGSDQPVAVAVVYYGPGRPNTAIMPSSQAWEDNVTACVDEGIDTPRPLFPIAPAPVPEKTFIIDITVGQNATNHTLWMMNNSTFRADFNDPLLLAASNGRGQFDANSNVIDAGQAKSFRVIVNNRTPASHPMHFHGHNMYILAQGSGEWDGVVKNPENPTRRDTFVIPGALPPNSGRANQYLVFQIDGDNPGTWPFHCHIAWHASGGLFVNFLERKNEVSNLNIPYTIKQTCDQWDDWSRNHVVPTIDSGV